MLGEACKCSLFWEDRISHSMARRRGTSSMATRGAGALGSSVLGDRNESLVRCITQRSIMGEGFAALHPFFRVSVLGSDFEGGAEVVCTSRRGRAVNITGCVQRHRRLWVDSVYAVIIE